MNLIERAKNILLTPKTEWPVIASETDTLSSLLTSYVAPLAAIPAGASLLSSFVISSGTTMKFAVVSAIIAYVIAVASFVITAYVVDFLADKFKSEKDLNKSAQLVAYSMTASWVAGLLTMIPGIGALAGLAGSVYSIYLMYIGVGPLKKTPEDQKVIYMVIIFVVLLVAIMALGSVLTGLILTSALV